MKTIYRIATVSIALVLMGGCALIINGTEEDVTVETTPAGAMAVVDSQISQRTPCTFSLSRNEDHYLELSMPGYKTVNVKIESGFGGMVLGNILFGGIIGAVADVASGASNTLSPDEISVDLQRGTGSVEWAPIKDGE